MVGHKVLHGISNFIPTQATENKQFLEVVQVCVPDARQDLPAIKPTYHSEPAYRKPQAHEFCQMYGGSQENRARSTGRCGHRGRARPGLSEEVSGWAYFWGLLLGPWEHTVGASTPVRLSTVKDGLELREVLHEVGREGRKGWQV